MTRAAEAKQDDSGIVDLAAASQADPHAAARAQNTALASQGLFDDESMLTQRPPVSAPPQTFGGYAHAHGQLQQPAPSLPPPSPSIAPAASAANALTATTATTAPAVAPANAYAPVAVAGAAADSAGVYALPPEKKSRTALALVVGGVLAIGAIAAGGLFVVKTRSAPATLATTESAARETPAAKAAPTEAAAATTVAVATPPASPAEAMMDPNALPTAETTPAPGARGKVASASKSGSRVAAAAAPVKAEAPAKPEGPAKMTEKDLAPAPSGPAGDLGKAMQKEVGDDAVKPAAASVGNAPAGNVPQKPSQGALTGALGAVLPNARACLGPDDPISRASVVFESGGTVQSVSVSGGAAGKPAEACIKSALVKAKVQPFAEASYTAPVTIRHN